MPETHRGELHRITLTLGTLRGLRQMTPDCPRADVHELLRVTEDLPEDTPIYITPDACGVEQKACAAVGSE